MTIQHESLPGVVAGLYAKMLWERIPLWGHRGGLATRLYSQVERFFLRIEEKSVAQSETVRGWHQQGAS